MKIQRGIVKYKDRNDIVCTYALTDDGLQYYFLDEAEPNKISNGNRIATTALVEAVDPMVSATNVGVIDSNGAIVIPFENRSIRLANENTLIVEKAVPTSQSVLDAIELRNDPAAATQLVSTPASIKDRLKAQMGVDGNYLFNDQFSEATICDGNGNNLVQGESYSFICMANDRLYLSKNTVDSPISEFSLTTYELTTSQPVAAPEETMDAIAAPTVPTEVAETALPPEEAIDVSAATVDPQVVEGALSETVAVQEPAAPAEGVDPEPIMPSVPFETAEETPVDLPAVATEEVPVEGVENAPVTNETEIVGEPISTEETPSEESFTPTDLPTETVENAEVPAEEAVEAPQEDIIREVIDIPEEEITHDEANAEETAQNITDDLKAFADGIPSEEETKGEADLPPVVEENVSQVSPEEVEEVTTESVVGEKEDDVHDVIDIPEEEAKGDLPPEDKHESIEEIFSPNVLEDDKLVEEDNKGPVNIDAETVFATLDKNQNGILDNDEVVAPQHASANSAPETMLSDIFNTSPSTKDYDLASSFESIYTPTSSYDSIASFESDPLMRDVAKYMSELMKKTKEQRGVITQYQSKLDSLEAQSRALSDKYKDQSIRYEALVGKLRSLEEAMGRVDSRNQILENKVHDQERIIASQAKQIGVLEPQVKGKEELVKLLADARAMLGSDSYGYEEGNHFYGGRAA